jgi:hypothetical protein
MGSLDCFQSDQIASSLTSWSCQLAVTWGSDNGVASPSGSAVIPELDAV